MAENVAVIESSSKDDQETIQHGPLPQIACRTIQNRSVYGPLQPLGHTSEEIVRAILTSVQQPEISMCRDQRSALAYFREGTKYLKSGVLPGVPNSREWMDYYFSIFDRLFFFRSIRKHVRWSFEKRRSIMGKYVGLCYDRRPYARPSTISSRILLLPLSEVHAGQQLQAQVSTLLHEMTHAVFHIYACRCRRRCRQIEEQDECGRNHSHSWNLLAVGLEGAAKRLLGLELNMWVFNSLLDDIMTTRSGAGLTEAKLLAWKIDKQKLGSAVYTYQWHMDWDLWWDHFREYTWFDFPFGGERLF